MGLCSILKSGTRCTDVHCILYGCCFPHGLKFRYKNPPGDMEVQWFGKTGQAPTACRCSSFGQRLNGLRKFKILKFHTSLIRSGRKLRFDPLQVERAVRMAVSSAGGDSNDPDGEKDDIQ